jgi:hypothetical protein
MSTMVSSQAEIVPMTAEAIMEDKAKQVYYSRIKQHFSRAEKAKATWLRLGNEMLIATWEAGRVVVELYNLAVSNGWNLMPFWADMASKTGCSESWLRQARKIAEAYKTKEELASFAGTTDALVFAGAVKERERQSVAERKAAVEAEKKAAIEAALEAARLKAAEAAMVEAGRPIVETSVPSAAGVEEVIPVAATPKQHAEMLRGGVPVPIDEQGAIDDGPLVPEIEAGISVVDRLMEVVELLSPIETIGTEEEKAWFFEVLAHIDRLRGIAS